MTDYERTSEDVQSKGGGGERKRKGEEKKTKGEERGRFDVGRITVVAILRTFTASQFFRLIIQHARMHLDPLGDCISNGRPQTEILKTEKGQLYVERAKFKSPVITVWKM